MPLPQDIVERLLVACHRQCCICHKPAGTKMEIHHIIPKSEGGEDTEENGIPLCFDCHAEVAAYNPQHPKGRRYTPSELRKHKEQWFAICAKAPWDLTIRGHNDISLGDININDEIFDNLRPENPSGIKRIVASAS